MNRWKITRPVESKGMGVSNDTEYTIVEAPQKPTPRGVVSVEEADNALPLSALGVFTPTPSETSGNSSAAPVNAPTGGN